MRLLESTRLRHLVFGLAVLMLSLPLRLESALTYAGIHQFMRPKSGADRKALALLAQMTLEEKIGQMTQVDMAALKEKEDFTRLAIGSNTSCGKFVSKYI